MKTATHQTATPSAVPGKRYGQPCGHACDPECDSALTGDIRWDLHERLLSLSYHAFEACVRDLLTAMGYTGVRLLDRTAWRQRTGHGGLDLEAYSETGLTRARVILQLKQYVRPVSRRFVDELRGAMLRTGARQGLLVTTSTFSRAAKQAATGDHYAQVAPIRLVDGEELISLLIAHRVGVWQECEPPQEPAAPGAGRPTTPCPGVGGRYGLDLSYFDDLMARFPGVVRRGRRF